MRQMATITFQTTSNGKIPVTVETYNAPVLITGLIRHTQWDMEQMTVEEEGPPLWQQQESLLKIREIQAVLDRIQQQEGPLKDDQLGFESTRLWAALDEIAEICKELEEE